MLSSLALRCNQCYSLVLMHLLPLYMTALQGHYTGSAVGLVFFRCSRTALQDHLTVSAVGLGFYEAVGLPRKGIVKVVL